MLARLLGWGIYWLLRALRATWRVRISGAPAPGALYAFWHGDQLALTAARVADVAVLVSRSQDGEMAAHAARRMKLQVVRGGSSTGGATAALRLVRRLREGRAVALAVDGPRGPREVVKPGAARIARAASSGIVPVAVVASRALRLRSWDRMLVPAPFSRVSVVWGEAIEAACPLDLALQATRRRAEQAL